jgi:N-acetylneuraminic acid mutarotase
VRDSVFKYDSVTNAWSTLTSMPASCWNHSACVRGDYVYIIGFLRFDPATNVWDTLAPTSFDREDGVSFVLGGCVFAAGGQGDESSVERYDVASDSWTAVANMLHRREEFAAVTIGSAGLAEKQDLFDALIAKASRQSLQ